MNEEMLDQIAWECVRHVARVIENVGQDHAAEQTDILYKRLTTDVPIDIKDVIAQSQSPGEEYIKQSFYMIIALEMRHSVILNTLSTYLGHMMQGALKLNDNDTEYVSRQVAVYARDVLQDSSGASERKALNEIINHFRQRPGK
jgi:hypothetical protein